MRYPVLFSILLVFLLFSCDNKYERLPNMPETPEAPSKSYMLALEDSIKGFVIAVEAQKISTGFQVIADLRYYDLECSNNSNPWKDRACLESLSERKRTISRKEWGKVRTLSRVIRSKTYSILNPGVQEDDKHNSPYISFIADTGSIFGRKWAIYNRDAVPQEMQELKDYLFRMVDLN